MIEYYASIATLILFIIYFISRFWSIIQSNLVEGIPQYMIEYQSNDFTMGWLLFAENGKNGIVDELIYKKHTAKKCIVCFV